MQKVVGPFAEIVTEGKGLTVTVVGREVALHPFASVTITVYEPEATAFILCVTAPVFHR